MKREKLFISFMSFLVKIYFHSLLVLLTCTLICKGSKPDAKTWANSTSGDRGLLGLWLITGTNSRGGYVAPNVTRHIEYEGYDGFYNNPAHPDLGAVDTPLLRRIPAAYEDGVYQPSGKDRPSPLELSDKLMTGPIGSKSRFGRNALLVFFGQQVVEEILDAQRPACPPEYFNVNIPPDHKFHTEAPKHSEMPLLRTRYDARTGYSPNNPRQQLNEITPWLDGGLTYGTTKTWSDQLRTYSNGTLDENGLLAASHGGLFPEYNTVRLPMANPPPPACHGVYVNRHSTEKVERFFKLGNPRGNENPFLLSFGVLWFRWHNFLAKEIKKANPTWNGEKIFNEARKWVIATHQHIVVNEWLPTWLGSRLEDYKHYDPSIDPQIDQFFQSAAFRFGHTLVPPGVYLRDYGRNGCAYSTLSGRNGDMNGTVRTCNSFWQPQTSILSKYHDTQEVMNIDRLLMGMALQLSEEEDHKIVEDLRGNVFGPLEFSRRDLMAVNIQRGRDHGLPDYNTIRKSFGLPELTISNINQTFPSISIGIRDAFLDIHQNDLSKVDLWVGGLLETVDGPGPLFTAIIKDQFRRIRDGDRFWYQNKQNGLFTESEVARLESLKFYDIIMAVTDMDWNDAQPNVFMAPTAASQIAPSCFSRLTNSTCNTTLCYHLPQLNNNTVSACTKPGTYDYFSGSEWSFIGTFVAIGVVILSFFGLVAILINIKDKKLNSKLSRIDPKVRNTLQAANTRYIHYSALEWVEAKAPLRHVVIILYTEARQIKVLDSLGESLRVIDVSRTDIIRMQTFKVYGGKELYFLIRVSHEYDLLLKFEDADMRMQFIEGLERFVDQLNIPIERHDKTLKETLNQMVTIQDRQKKIAHFFKTVFAKAFNLPKMSSLKKYNEARNSIGPSTNREIYTELTIKEFGNALGMKHDSEFVRKMFYLVDKDKNGFVSFLEFFDMLIIFANGSGADKTNLLFKMYDVEGTGVLTKEDFTNMIKSFVATVSAHVDETDLEVLVQEMLREAELDDKTSLNEEDFRTLLHSHEDKLNYAHLTFSGIAENHHANKIQKKSNRNTFIAEAFDTVNEMYSEETSAPTDSSNIDKDQESKIKSSLDQSVKFTWWLSFHRYIQTYIREIFWISLYTLVMLAVFAERAYYYSVEREHSGLRRIAGYGVTVTRGAASAMMFTYSSLLVTMCRNTITKLRDTFLHQYFPFDSSVFMHKYIACWALVFTVMHVIGHAFNFYSISTQTSNDLTCLFRNFFHSTHEIPKFHYWCWQTITGLTGVFLTILTSLIAIFAMPFARQKLYNEFWLTHSLYPLFFVLMILHGSGRLIQPPFTYYFLLGPCILFALDCVVTMRRNKVLIPVLRAELLPSNVTMLEFQKPCSFEYKSGQWVRIACLGLNSIEYHPFTISSAPNEKNLTVHIRAVGPWTTNIRNAYDPSRLMGSPLPKLHLDGPYGEGHQDWNQFDVAVLIGGGIGVTPFASILKDIVFRRNVKQHFNCKKVYFLWVTKTQKQFEWLVDIIRDVEKSDDTEISSIHIFVTQFYQKFDLRTILLYICERHFQKVRNRSLFTGLKAVTHFGRPNFGQFFKSVQVAHPQAVKVGVFSCGPLPMTRMVDKECVSINKATRNEGPLFQHHFKNF